MTRDELLQKAGQRMGRLLVRYPWPLGVVTLTSALMLLAVPVARVLYPHGRELTGSVLTLWAIWDAPNYLSLALNGYMTSTDAANFIVFLPLLPLAIWASHWFTLGSTIVAGYFVALVCSGLSACMLYELVRGDSDVGAARRAVLFLFLFPTSIFLHLPYTESMFMVLALGVFLSLRHNRLYLAMALAALLTATRFQGIIIVPVILLELVMYHRAKVRRSPQLLLFAATIPCLGLAAYLYLNYHLFGSPLHFLQVQREHWYVYGVAPWVGFRNTVDAAQSWQGINLILLVYAQLAGALIGVVATTYAFLRLRLSYAVYAFGILVTSMATAHWVSLPRYIVVIFPLYIMLARLTRRRAAYLAGGALMAGLWVAAVLVGVEHGPLF